MLSERAIIVFDLGNVLVRLNPVSGLWPKLISGSEEAAKYEDLWSGCQAVHEYETGKITDYFTFYTRVCEELKIEASWREFQPVYESIIGEPYAETIPLLEQLSSRYRLFLLSNTSPVHWRRCRDDQGLGCFFERTFLSYEIGHMKPDSRIYQAVLDSLADQDIDLLYFDDRRENILAGAKQGFRACQTMGGLELAENFKRLGIIDYYPNNGP